MRYSSLCIRFGSKSRVAVLYFIIGMQKNQHLSCTKSVIASIHLYTRFYASYRVAVHVYTRYQLLARFINSGTLLCDKKKKSLKWSVIVSVFLSLFFVCSYYTYYKNSQCSYFRVCIMIQWFQLRSLLCVEY